MLNNPCPIINAFSSRDSEQGPAFSSNAGGGGQEQNPFLIAPTMTVTMTTTKTMVYIGDKLMEKEA
jgi:hypothetical protein